MKTTLSVLALAAALAFGGAPDGHAQVSADVVKIGLLPGLSGLR